jgi:sugar lactone lactonase YvrE
MGAVYRGGAVRRCTSDGHPDEVIEVPARKVTACVIGRPGLDELFITMSREGLAADDDPLAGALFRVVPGVRGEPVREFAG